MEIEQFTLPNGIRVVHRHLKETPISHCGLMISAGSRDELEEEQGMAHFIEHNLFKGTKNRKPYHILNRMDSVGGELNAFTSKEETCIQCSFLNEYYERSIELLSDILFHSTFPDKELEKEKEVIIDEINSYQDSPGDQIFDDFEELLFASHPIGRNILGTKKSIRKFTREDVIEFIHRNYQPENIVFSSAGNISVKKIKRLCEKHFSRDISSYVKKPRPLFTHYLPQQSVKQQSNFQAHSIMGNISYSASNPKRRALSLLNNILGGPAMNSRLNLNIREKYGFTYNIESNYTAYTDTGNFCIYIGTDEAYLERTQKLVLKELAKLRSKKLGVSQLHSGKQQLIGHIALARENKANVMLHAAKSILLFDRVESLEEIHRKIEAITADDLLEVANEIFDTEQFSSLTFLPKN